MRKNTCMNASKGRDDDEFYTKYEDIENELVYYWDQLRGKSIYCNCDDPRKSNFCRYFFDNFSEIGIRRLVCTCRSEERNLFSADSCGSMINVTNTNGMTFDEFLNGDPIVGMCGDGDLFGPECMEILRESDVIVTNPPFSMLRKFIELMIEEEKKFLVIGNHNVLTAKKIFEMLKEEKIRTGHGGFWMNFMRPDGSEKFVGSTAWITNLEVDAKRPWIELKERYFEGKYEVFDGSDILSVDKTAMMPCDYNGVVGVPVSMLPKFNYEQFELVGLVSMAGCKYKVADSIVGGVMKFKRIAVRLRNPVDGTACGW